MTDRPTPHLDDEALSAAVDGHGDTAHLDGCATCRARFEELAAVGRAIASAPVAPLPAGDLDRMIARALDDADADVPVPVPVPAPVGRRLRTPPPMWLLGAAAAIALLVGMAGLLRTDDGSSQQAQVRLDDAGGAADASGSPTAGGGDRFAAGPGGDLGDVADETDLVARLTGASATTSGATTGAAADAAPSAEAARAPTPAGPPPDASCRAEAERIGAGRLGALETSATLRWDGTPAEVLVFALTEPAEGVSRQALVLARPGCRLLADPRF